MATQPTLAQARKLEQLLSQVRTLGAESELIKPSYLIYLRSMEENVSRHYRKAINQPK